MNQASSVAVRLLATLLVATIPIINAGEPQAASAEAQLLALDQVRLEAEVKHDREALERILDEELVVIFKSGKVEDRAGFIDMIMSQPIDP